MEQSAQMTRTANVVTAIPGPKSQAILDRKDKAVAEAMTIHIPVAIAKGDGATITDVDGNTFLDFSGGIGCLNVGHTNSRVVEAIKKQTELFTHTDFTVVMYENYVELAERLGKTIPIDGPVKAAFFNSGAEAVENGIKIARAATGRPAVITFERAFHGRTLMAMSLTSKTHPYKAGFGPFAPEVYRAPYPYPRWFDGTDEECAEACLAELREMFVTHVAAEHVAAIIFEPVQGEGGFIVPPKSFLKGLREICDEHGIVLICDEVQSGIGRTGTMWAIEQFDVEPDLILTAKSIALGLPLSGVLGKAKIMDAVGDSAMGGTYVGNPVGCAAALAVLDELEGGLLARGKQLGDTLRAGLEDIAAADGNVAEVRGLGPMLAIEFLDTPSKTGGERATATYEHAMQNGLILLKAGTKGNCIRVLVSFVLTDDQAAEALDILGAAVRASA
jgi:4-aminobutyrate aminotransferase/(S)-3-amino-2-methylpropionate transaminase